MQVNLCGKVALVTGASRGIGEAIAHSLASNGARVIFADLDLDTAAATAKNAGYDSFPLRIDVGDEAEVQSSVAEVLARCGRLDILVNNAGINTLKKRVTIDEFSLDEWNRVLQVDLTGLFMMSREAARPMLAQGEGRIINIAS